MLLKAIIKDRTGTVHAIRQVLGGIHSGRSDLGTGRCRAYQPASGHVASPPAISCPPIVVDGLAMDQWLVVRDALALPGFLRSPPSRARQDYHPDRGSGPYAKRRAAKRYRARCKDVDEYEW